jgi:hypothetical protein
MKCQKQNCKEKAEIELVNYNVTNGSKNKEFYCEKHYKDINKHYKEIINLK